MDSNQLLVYLCFLQANTREFKSFLNIFHLNLYMKMKQNYFFIVIIASICLIDYAHSTQMRK